MVLKVCEHQHIENSAFWRGMNRLFAIDFPASLENIATIYQFVSRLSPLVIPQFIAAKASSFVLARWLPGDILQSEKVTQNSVELLAAHLGLLHRQQQTRWGTIQQPQFTAAEWQTRLQDTLQTLAGEMTDPFCSEVLQQAVEQVSTLVEDCFVPIMPDLRWDQFLTHQATLALVDLDAVVYGPRTLEFVLLEYLLDDAQSAHFIRTYQSYLPVPDLSAVRDAYRLLLFLMNVLGETDLKKWLAAPQRF